MKNIILITFCLFNSILVSNAQVLTSETINKNIIGYWQKIGDGNPSVFEAEKNEIVLVINSDKTIIYYENRRKLGWGNYSVDSMKMFKLNTTMHKNNALLPSPYDVVSVGGYIMQADNKKLVFGYAAVDGTDAVYERMTTKQVDIFYGEKLLSKAFRKKSDELLLEYFKEWQQMEPTNETEMPPDVLDKYQKEAYAFFNDYYSALLEDNEVPKFTIIELSLHNVGNTNLELPSTLEMDSFVNKMTGKKDYRAEIKDEKVYDRIKEDFWGRYFENKLAEQKIEYHKLYNFNPPIYGKKNITYLLLRPDRKRVIDYCMRNNDKKYKNWLFIEKYLYSGGGGVQYDITDTPMIQKLVFNTQLNLLIVDYVYSYSWVKDLYEKKEGKWQFHSTIMNMTE